VHVLTPARSIAHSLSPSHTHTPPDTHGVRFEIGYILQGAHRTPGFFYIYIYNKFVLYLFYYTGVTFESGDMLHDALDDAKILILASQCWDAELRAAVSRKLRGLGSKP